MDFEEREKEIFSLIEKLNDGEGKGEMSALIQEAKEKLSKEWKYEIQRSEFTKGFVGSYELNVSSVKVEKELVFDDVDSVVNQLQEQLDRIQESKASVQEELVEICNKKRNEAGELGTRINGELEEVFKAEDTRIQEVVKVIKEKIDSKDPEEVEELARKARLTLFKNQKYSLRKEDSSDSYDLKVIKEASLKFIDFEERKPRSLIPSFTKKGEFSLSFTFFDEDEGEVLKEVDSPCKVEVKVWEKGNEEGTSKTLTKEHTLGSDEPICLRSTFMASTPYCLKTRIVHQGMSTQWSDEGEFTTPEFKDLCMWKECPDDVYTWMKYSVGEENPRIATMNGSDGYFSIIIGNTPLPPNKVTSWSIKILESITVYIGVALSDINQNEEDNPEKCGWYFYCLDSTLFSGPPHNYRRKEYGPRKGLGQYVHTGDSVGVVMDGLRSELSFALNGVNLGVAYKGIPLDKPLVPCVILLNEGDSIELNTSEVKENVVDSSIPVSSSITAKSTTWDSITLTWDAVEGASFYQIEVDGSKFWDASTTNLFTKRGLLADTENTFRVRVVRGNSVSGWSDVVKERTQNAPDFSECVWKECPDEISEDRRYSVDEENSRIATRVCKYGRCIIVGNTALPLDKVTSWSIKILKSKDNDGRGIYIGVAPSDINQNGYDNFNKCGWYFECCGLALYSDSPHKYWNKEYGPRKEKNGEYVHTGDSVGVVMDAAKGELSFVVNGVNFGVAYEGISLDKPLVPSVTLENEGDSVELDTSEVKENAVDSSISVPSNITTKNGSTWDSITLTWDAVEGASFYQIEVDESKFWDASTTNLFIKTRLLPETEHTFRVRAVKRNSVSKWSNVVKERTEKPADFSGCVWKECPDYVDEENKYSVDEKNPRIAAKIGGDYCVIIGNTPLPPNKVTSWGIKSGMAVGSAIVGVAPSDIDQNLIGCTYPTEYGWYFYCCKSTLWSGPPYNYECKEYGPRKEDRKYVYTGDSVGVVMDTTKGDLSFVVDGVNLGVAYEGIPLGKPLVPCVILGNNGAPVELVI